MNIPARPWTRQQPPRRILAIRLQAMGDVVITLPYLRGLRESLPPSTELDLLTREETKGIPGSIHLFDNVYALGGGRDHKKIMLHTLMMLPRLLLRRYDVILDLQNNIYSDIVRKTLRPKGWALYDRYSPVSAAERYRLTIEAAGLGPNQASHSLQLKDATQGLGLLYDKGWNGADDLVALNPAGAFITRNWDIKNYAAFARLWLLQRPRPTGEVARGIVRAPVEDAPPLALLLDDLAAVLRARHAHLLEDRPGALALRVPRTRQELSTSIDLEPDYVIATPLYNDVPHLVLP